MAKEKLKTLLLVEDDPGLQSQLRWSFDSYEVVVAENRAAAIAQLRRYEPPVVTLDLGLPPDPANASEGLAALEEILRLAPHTKVIVVTGNDDRENALRAVAAGGGLTRPCDSAWLSPETSRSALPTARATLSSRRSRLGQGWP